jgi:hypothetical protein
MTNAIKVLLQMTSVSLQSVPTLNIYWTILTKLTQFDIPSGPDITCQKKSGMKYLRQILITIFSMPVSSGVTQGSNLGPILFNIFVNDVVQYVNGVVFLHADDLKIVKYIRTLSDCESLKIV